jgi:hypothetical protein
MTAWRTENRYISYKLDGKYMKANAGHATKYMGLFSLARK